MKIKSLKSSTKLQSFGFKKINWNGIGVKDILETGSEEACLAFEKKMKAIRPKGNDVNLTAGLISQGSNVLQLSARTKTGILNSFAIIDNNFLKNQSNILDALQNLVNQINEQRAFQKQLKANSTNYIN